MHDTYDWFTDIWLPALVGVGLIAVGLIAARVARQSNNLAMQVRRDEAKRDEAAARERYRDQLFRTVEPAVATVMDHRAALMAGDWQTVHRRGTHAAVIMRLNFISAIANEEDRKVSTAAIDAYEAAAQTDDQSTFKDALAAIALVLPNLCSDDRIVAELVAALKDPGAATAGL